MQTAVGLCDRAKEPRPQGRALYSVHQQMHIQNHTAYPAYQNLVDDSQGPLLQRLQFLTVQ